MATPTCLIPGSILGTASTTLYTSPAGITTLIKHLAIANTSAAAATAELTIHRATGTSVVMTPNVSVGPSAPPYIAAELTNEVLNPGDSIQGLASVAAVLNVIASGIQF